MSAPYTLATPIGVRTISSDDPFIPAETLIQPSSSSSRSSRSHYSRSRRSSIIDAYDPTPASSDDVDLAPTAVNTPHDTSRRSIASVHSQENKSRDQFEPEGAEHEQPQQQQPNSEEGSEPDSHATATAESSDQYIPKAEKSEKGQGRQNSTGEKRKQENKEDEWSYEQQLKVSHDPPQSLNDGEQS